MPPCPPPGKRTVVRIRAVWAVSKSNFEFWVCSPANPKLKRLRLVLVRIADEGVSLRPDARVLCASGLGCSQQRATTGTNTNQNHLDQPTIIFRLSFKPVCLSCRCVKTNPGSSQVLSSCPACSTTLVEFARLLFGEDFVI
jgi:hypothetical protein